MHKLLERQLKRHLGDLPDLPESMRPFLDAIDAAYAQWDDERRMLEHSIETVSAEFVERYQNQQHLEEQLRQSQKMEAVGRLAGGIAHDFNNLITGIVFNAGLLLEETSLTDEQRSEIKDMERSAQRAAALTRQLLTFSRKQVYRPETLDLNDVVRDLERMLARLLTETIHLVCDLDPEPCAVEIDRTQFEQAILNLTINARDAMPTGGVVTIETKRTVETTTDGKARRVRLTVRDTGHGIDAQTREKMFEPFFTTKPAGSGTGLGLATVYAVVRQAGGTIDVESELGRGAAFRIVLPFSESAPVRRNTPSVPVRSLQRSGTILVVEDENVVRESIKRALEKHGYTVKQARHGADAINAFEARPGDFDLVISDVVMPGMSGPDLVKSLRAIKPSIKAILMSGYTHGALNGDQLREIDVPLLQKPFKPTALLRIVDETMAPAGV